MIEIFSLFPIITYTFFCLKCKGCYKNKFLFNSKCEINLIKITYILGYLYSRLNYITRDNYIFPTCIYTLVYNVLNNIIIIV